MNLGLQSNDGWARNQFPDCFDVSAAVHDHVGFARQEQTNGTTCRTDVDWFKIGV
jgi:hypothetical protein